MEVEKCKIHNNRGCKKVIVIILITNTVKVHYLGKK